MIHVKDHKTHDMFNPFEYLGPRRLALLEKSWAHLFREEILHRLPVEKLYPFYNEFRGRRTKELYAMLGLVILQQMEDLTDEETVQQFAFNILWQYALNVTDATDFSSYVSPRTLWTMRDIVAQNDLQQTLFENVTETLQKLFDLDPSKQRLDSVHLFSNMRHLGRVRLFGATIKKFLVNLKRHHGAEYVELSELTDRYAKKSDAAFAVKPSESQKKLQELGDDCFLLVERFKDHKDVRDMSSYKLLVRLFSEQCVLEKDSEGSKVAIKPNADVPSDSLQNPSDPDAGYCGHKGKGYQMQVMETYSPDKEQPDLITYVKVEAANESDANALLPAIEDAQEHDLAPSELLADSLYGSDDNVEKAKEQGVEVVAPAMGPQEQAITLADFQFSETDEIIACPTGQLPQRVKIGKKGGIIVHFEKNVCDHCPLQSGCPVKREKKRCTISYDAKSLRLARRRKQEPTPEFKDRYRYRAGVEATMSDLDRITGIKKLRVRGKDQVTLAATLKAAGLNIHRANAFRNRKKQGTNGQHASQSGQNHHLSAIKEHLLIVISHFRAFACNFRFGNNLPDEFLGMAV